MDPSERPTRKIETDADLIRRVADDGDTGAFETLMNRYHARVYGLIMRMVGNRERAADLTQEAFLKVWRALPRFQGDAAFFTWVYRIVRNLVVSDHRRQAARPKVALSLDRGSSADDERMDVADLSMEPSRCVEAEERQAALLGALHGLPADFKEVVVLKDIEGYSYEDIGELLDVPVGTVRSRLHRARLELKNAFHRRVGGGADES